MPNEERISRIGERARAAKEAFLAEQEEADRRRLDASARRERVAAFVNEASVIVDEVISCISERFSNIPLEIIEDNSYGYNVTGSLLEKTFVVRGWTGEGARYHWHFRIHDGGRVHAHYTSAGQKKMMAQSCDYESFTREWVEESFLSFLDDIPF